MQDHPIPIIDDDDILFQVVAAAQNPADWRRCMLTVVVPLYTDY